MFLKNFITFAPDYCGEPLKSKKNMKNLVIVESPAKAKTIERFLGKDYKVLPSYGHIRDLRKKDFSIDIEHGFKPIYEVPEDKKRVVASLKQEADKADTIWLASDEDREGEAISWHLSEVLKLNKKNTKRIVFHEITKNAILQAIEQPRDIDLNLVNAQQARRVLDRIVGFELSPLLWKKVKPSLSAGRVQSVTVRLIVEREREIQNFKSESSYKVAAVFQLPNTDGKAVNLKADLDARFAKKEEAVKFLESCKDAVFTISDITTHPYKKFPAPPFTTSTLQQEAARKLGFTVNQTMMVAQKLYEDGKITYMRTDSVNLSSLAINTCKQAIREHMGDEYVHPRQFTTKAKGAQEAHEAIRPTYINKVKIEGTAQEKKLYDLIWKRTIASQMAEAETEKTTVIISIDKSDLKFIANGEVIKFDGFMRVYKESASDDELEQEAENNALPPLQNGQQLTRKSITATEKYTQRPTRYTEAALVHKLEELGIGRPSTYAPTISTIQQRDYVTKGDKPGVERSYNILTLQKTGISDVTKTEVSGAEKGKLLPTDIGMVVNDYLTEAFPDIVSYNFTASVEKRFDEIAEGNEEWTTAMKDFYDKFHPEIDAALTTKNEHKVGERMLGTDPASGRPVSVKIGRYGPVAQIGSASDKDKPRFAQLKKNMSIETATLEEVLELFKLPRDLGQINGKKVSVGAGRFGPYIYYNASYTSIPKSIDPMEITLEEAQALINAKAEADAKKHLRTFEEEPGLEIMNGRFGPYIAYQGNNYKIAKGTDPMTLTLEQCKEIISKEDAKPKASAAKRVGRRTARSTK